MSAIDKLRSFAESHEPDATPIRDGLTYGDAREQLAQLAECAAGPWHYEGRTTEPGQYLYRRSRCSRAETTTCEQGEVLTAGTDPIGVYCWAGPILLPAAEVKSDALLCSHCPNPATCETRLRDGTIDSHCDDCCGHEQEAAECRAIGKEADCG